MSRPPKPLHEMTAAELCTELSYATTACWNVRWGFTEEKKGRILDRVDAVNGEIRKRLEAAEKASHHRGTESAEEGMGMGVQTPNPNPKTPDPRDRRGPHRPGGVSE